MSTELSEREPVSLEERSQKAARLAVDRALGDDASPELKKAAAEMLSPWAVKLVRWLDDLIKVPGTNFGIGLDPLIGLVFPGAGDAITGTGSLALIWLAFRERVPTIVLFRMVGNILVDTLFGLLPGVGDVFDLFFRSNKRNLALIEKYRDDPKAEPTWKDYALVATGVTLAVLSIVLPIVIVYVIGVGSILALVNES